MLRPHARSWEPATVPGRLWDTGYGYPAAVFGAQVPGMVVPGVVVDVTPDAWPVLDEIEEVGVLYRKVQVETSCGPAVGYEWLGSTDGMALLGEGWPPTRNW